MVALRNSNYLSIRITSECTSLQNVPHHNIIHRMKHTAGIKTSGRLQMFSKELAKDDKLSNQLRKRSLSLRSVIDRSTNFHDPSQGKDHTMLYSVPTIVARKKHLGYHWLSSLNVCHIAMLHKQICLYKRHME